MKIINLPNDPMNGGLNHESITILKSTISDLQQRNWLNSQELIFFFFFFFFFFFVNVFFLVFFGFLFQKLFFHFYCFWFVFCFFFTFLFFGLFVFWFVCFLLLFFFLEGGWEENMMLMTLYKSFITCPRKAP